MVLDLNSLGTVIPSQTFLRQFAEQRRGNIINVTSMAAVRPLTNTPAYGLGKAAVQNFTEWLAVQVRIDFPDADIRVNAIAPGFLNTAQNHRLLYEEDDRTLTARGKSILDHTPLGRFGEPEELLGPILLLLSDAGRFMHGTTIVVDGGFSVYSGVGPLKRHLSMELESQGDGGPIV
jgi:NAD(P)-dependent dehydrogenase (short-subunit alcohol dehydrogenase family)